MVDLSWEGCQRSLYGHYFRQPFPRRNRNAAATPGQLPEMTSEPAPLSSMLAEPRSRTPEPTPSEPSPEKIDEPSSRAEEPTPTSDSMSAMRDSMLFLPWM